MLNFQTILQEILAGFKGLSLASIAQDIFGAGSVAGDVAAAQSELEKILDSEEATAGFTSLGHPTVKLLENAMGPTAPGTVDQRIAVGQALAKNAAAAFVNCGALYLALEQAQEVEENARSAGGSALDTARAARNTAEQVYRAQLASVGKIIAGQA